ncbi:hypothetical protein BX600DRAFT_502101 [Xylariales sp. PMI_506]|nr:hypothetical protein BX600DRAFT_502101 [Xylariales sp. PMI_506]
MIDYDIIIVGAGVAGIDTAYHIQKDGPRGTTYAILESRARVGGTWDLFIYPGIRSDSSMQTFAFPWNLWTGQEYLAPGHRIRSYLEDSAAKFGIDKHILFHHKVVSAEWSSKLKVWKLEVQQEGHIIVLHSRFLVLGAGYYNYNEPLNSTIPGLENFRGLVIQPQFWPESFDYAGKDIAIIGSGATAITLLPNLAEKAKSVTMVQRSPSYIMPAGPSSRIPKFLQRILPYSIQRRLNRLIAIYFGIYLYNWCMAKPEEAKRRLEKIIAPLLPPTIPLDPHFKPSYNPWEQRLCVSPGGDFFAALRGGTAHIATGEIETVGERSIVLRSGQTIEADVIVAATGLKLQFGGGVELSVDGEVIDIPSKFAWKGCMVQDVPNFMFLFGYVSSSWTLAMQSSSAVFTRLLYVMKRRKAAVVTPRVPDGQVMEEFQFINLSSTYTKSPLQVFPKAGTGQWGRKTSYFRDMWDAWWGDVTTGLQMDRDEPDASQTHLKMT